VDRRFQLSSFVGVGLAQIIAFAALAADADPPAEQRWTLRVAGETIGHEVITQRVVEDRWSVHSSGSLEARGVTGFEQTTVADMKTGVCADYRFSATTRSGPVAAHTQRTEGGVGFSVTAAGATVERTGDGEPPILCMDNAGLAHYEILGRVAQRHAGEAFNFTVAIPQILRALPASFEPGPIVNVRIGDSVREAREGKLTIAGTTSHFWYDATDGRAYRVEVGSQRFVAELEGWSGVIAVEPGSP